MAVNLTDTDVGHTPTTTITYETVIDGQVADALWCQADANFAPLAELAILPQYFGEEEFYGMLADADIIKIVAWDDTEPVGLGVVTNNLDTVPQISPTFLTARYPQFAAANTIYFGILVMVAAHTRGTHVFRDIALEVWDTAARAGGILVFDYCDFNRLLFQGETLSARLAARFPGANVKEIDRQSWYVAELPEPLLRTPLGTCAP